MKTLNIQLCVLSMLILVIAASCEGRFLDVKPEKRQRTPVTVGDFLGLMDNSDIMNRFSSHALGIIGGDEFYVNEIHFNSFPTDVNNLYQKNAYTWERNVYQGGEPQTIDWTRGYFHILWANMVIEGLQSIRRENNVEEWELAMGMALFHRAFNHYNLAQLYCPVYDVTTVNELGLPLRLETDVTANKSRSSLKETYDQILEDLQNALQLLPEKPATVFRPSKWSTYGLLSRIYLQMGDYKNAIIFAEQCLAIQNNLIDYNQIVDGTNYSFPLYGIDNSEVMLTTAVDNFSLYATARFNADTSLLASYCSNDLRRNVYFRPTNTGQISFVGSYYGNHLFFTGLAINEIYLIKAECLARLGDVTEAISTLNQLRYNRMARDGYIPLSSTNQEEVVDLVLEERRRELVLRGTRWEDLRRLNKEQRYAKTLVRQIGDKRYELPPGDVKYVWPLPLEAVEIGGYLQNER